MADVHYNTFLDNNIIAFIVNHNLVTKQNALILKMWRVFNFNNRENK